MLRRLLVQSVLALCLAGLLTHPAAAQPDVKSFLGTAGNIRLSEIHDRSLDSILGWLRVDLRIVPREEVVASFPALATPVVVVPLEQLDLPERVLFLFFLPDKKTYYILQADTQTSTDPEVRIWGTGASELTMAAKGLSWSRASSQNSLRLPANELARAGIRPMGAVDDALSCLGRQLGDLSGSSLGHLLANASCFATNTISLVLTATNCLSVPHPMATIGCVTGVAQLISCGFANCGVSPTPPFTPNPSSCVSRIELGLSNDRGN